MSLCAYCGYPTPDDGMCAYHAAPDLDDWARSNRIMCDFIHRGILRQAVRTDAHRRRVDLVEPALA